MPVSREQLERDRAGDQADKTDADREIEDQSEAQADEAEAEAAARR